jgi:hypothetical protein
MNNPKEELFQSKITSHPEVFPSGAGLIPAISPEGGDKNYSPPSLGFTLPNLLTAQGRSCRAQSCQEFLPKTEEEKNNLGHLSYTFQYLTLSLGKSKSHRVCPPLLLLQERCKNGNHGDKLGALFES